MKLSLAALLQWISIGEQVIDKGTAAWSDIQAALARNGIEADNALLDAVIADDVRRKGLAEQDAAVAQVHGTGSTGD